LGLLAKWVKVYVRAFSSKSVIVGESLWNDVVNNMITAIALAEITD